MRRSAIRRFSRAQVLVTTKHGVTFRGVLWDEDDRYLVLREAQLIGPDGQQVSADGEVLVRCPDISYLQAL